MHVPATRREHRPARGYGRTVLRRLSAVLVAGMLTVFAVLLLTGEYANDGPVILRLGQDRGIHEGDLFVVLGWAVGLASVAALVAGGRRDG